ncbi:MAG: hypothetical protein ABFS38_02940, partial [Bacteroidota bacterium]
MRRILQSATKSLMLAIGIWMLTGTMATAQSSVIVDPGANTIQAAMAANPGDTLILQKGKTYVVSSPIEITQPTVIMGQPYTLDGADPPAVIQGAADPGTEDAFYMILAAADLTLIDLGFIGFTYDNKQIECVVGISEGFHNMEAHGCILQGCRRWFETNEFPGTNWVLHDNIHFNISTTGWDNYGGMAGPMYKGDSLTNHTYNCTYFVGGRMMLTGSSGPYGWQHADHCTYVNTFGETFHKSKTDGYRVQNSIFFNTHLRGYVGERTKMDGADTVYYWGGDYVSYRQLGDTLNGDCAVFPHVLDSVPDGTDRRFVEITNNLKYNEQRALDWNEENNVSTQPFLAWAMRERAAEHGWTIDTNWTPDDGTDYDPQFEMGELPIGAFEASWAQRMDRMDPSIPDHEVAWRPGGEDQSVFIWPLPFDFTPQNPDLMTAGSDGYPLGDLNWLGKDVVEAWENGWANPVIERRGGQADLSLVNYPNPFYSNTQIKYNLTGNSHVIMKIYDVTGAEVANLVNENQI